MLNSKLEVMSLEKDLTVVADSFLKSLHQCTGHKRHNGVISKDSQNKKNRGYNFAAMKRPWCSHPSNYVDSAGGHFKEGVQELTEVQELRERNEHGNKTTAF